MAEVIRYVDPDASGLGDGSSWANAYTSLSAWNSAEATDLVSDGDSHHVYCRSSSGTADTTRVLLYTGWVTNTTHDITIEAADGDQAVKTKWDTSRYRPSVDSSSAISVLKHNVNLVGLQIECPQSDSSGNAVTVGYSTETPAVTIDSCYARGSTDNNSNSSGISVTTSYCDITIKNCICLSRSTRYQYDNTCINLKGTSNTIYNTVCYGGYSGIQIQTAGAATIKNCALFSDNTYQDNIRNSGTATIAYNASDDGDGTNSVSPSGSDWDNEFTDPANGDFTLLNTGNLYDAGIGPSSDSDVPTTDIDGDTRSGTTCDIGADEYVSSGGTTYTLEAGAGSYSLTGTSASLLFDRTLSAESGSTSITGDEAALLFDRLISADGGPYTITGQDAALLFNRLLSADGDSYALTGTDADLIYSRGFILTAESGDYNLTGYDADLRYSRGYILSAEAGSVIVTGTDAQLLRSFSLIAESGAASLTGQDVAFLRNYLIDAELGTISVTGSDATLFYSGAPILTFPLYGKLTELDFSGVLTVGKFYGKLAELDFEGETTV